MDEKEFINIRKKNSSDSTVIDVAGHRIGKKTFTIFAGPCRVESREQITRIAKALKKAGAHILRGGAFKPCTSPHSDWGRGEAALGELRDASKAVGMPCVSEAMSIEELDLVSKYSDMMQIGMRNGQNYNFLKCLGDYANPILLKRGTWMDLRETLCAAEWAYFTDKKRKVKGNKNIVMCERGSVHFNKHMRWTLDLAMVPSFKQVSHLPMIVDISHGTGGPGNVSYYKDLARAVVAVGADGLMVEVHTEPEKSASDAVQTIDLAEFEALVDYIRPVVKAVGREI